AALLGALQELTTYAECDRNSWLGQREFVGPTPSAVGWFNALAGTFGSCSSVPLLPLSPGNPNESSAPNPTDVIYRSRFAIRALMARSAGEHMSELDCLGLALDEWDFWVMMNSVEARTVSIQHSGLLYLSLPQVEYYNSLASRVYQLIPDKRI